MPLRRFIYNHLQWIPLVLLVPLVTVGLCWQYRWLSESQRNSALAQTANLKNYLESVANRVEYTYKTQAERALNIPDELLHDEGVDGIVQFFKKKDPRGAKLLFVVNFANPRWSEILLYDPLTEVFGEPARPEMGRAIMLALAPWKALHAEGATLQQYTISTEEKDPRNRIILNPLTDASGYVLGVAGMIVDEEHFLRDVLPMAIGGSLPKLTNSGEWDDLLISVTDGEGRVVRGFTGDQSGRLHVRGRIPFIFSDWELRMGYRSDPEALALSSFRLNMTLSVALVVLLVGVVLWGLRTASRAMRLSRMKTEFIANVSHELRTPLASVRVFGEFMRLGRVNDPQRIREYGEYIETQSRRLAAMVENILDFSRIESSAWSYRFVPTGVRELVVQTVRSMEPSSAHNGTQIRLEIDDTGLPPQINLDPVAIARALVNLIDNAVKHSTAPATVTVGVAGDPGEVRIWVRDEGPGIPRSEQRRIFDRFHRVADGLVHDVKGTGLGLSIVDHIVKAHGGSVDVESELGRGSTFTLRLPVRVGAADVAGPLESASAVETRAHDAIGSKRPAEN
jgi:signal transduction histidine kinase